jgi:hypothetical protein
MEPLLSTGITEFGEDVAIFVMVKDNRNVSVVREFSSVVALIRIAVSLRTIH